MNESLTVIAPTKNRHLFLRRFLLYLESLKFGGKILIGDSSDNDADDLQKNQVLVHKLSQNLNISYHEIHDVENEPQATKRLSKIVSTKYATWAGDDDFFIPRGMERCAKFLDENIDYAAAHGIGIKINTVNDKVFGKIASVGIKRQPVYEEELPSIRHLRAGLFRSAKHKVDLHFSVHRRENIEEAYREADNQDKAFSCRKLNHLVPILGKVKGLNCLTLVKHMHNAHLRSVSQKSPLGWIRQDAWASEYREYTKKLAGRISDLQEISIEEAIDIVNISLQYDLGKRLEADAMMKTKKNLLWDASERQKAELFLSDSRLISIYLSLRRLFVDYPEEIIRGVFWRLAKLNHREIDLSLEALSHRKHPFFDDFLAVRKIIEQGSSGLSD